MESILISRMTKVGNQLTMPQIMKLGNCLIIDYDLVFLIKIKIILFISLFIDLFRFLAFLNHHCDISNK